MGTRVFIHGQPVFQRGRMFRPQPGHTDEDHRRQASQPIPREKAAELTVGTPWWDKDDELTYRVVSEGRLTPEGGWATKEFWLKEFGTKWALFRELVERGIFDCAMEENTQIRRFRLLDRGKADRALEQIRARRRARRPVEV